MIDLETIDNEEAREKAVNKCLESDCKKAQKVKEAEKKAERKENEILEKASKCLQSLTAKEGLMSQLFPQWIMVPNITVSLLEVQDGIQLTSSYPKSWFY